MRSEAGRHPEVSAIAATGGRKMSWPVAWPAASVPMTRPRRVTNQRLAIVSANTSAMEPVPRPMSRPQKTMSIHD